MSCVNKYNKIVFQELREFLWVSRGTRLLSVDFTLYNANVNFFAVVKIYFEFPPTGGLLKDINIRTIKARISELLISKLSSLLDLLY